MIEFVFFMTLVEAAGRLWKRQYSVSPTYWYPTDINWSSFIY